ncbi:MAG: hypothetical protein Q3X96_08715 [Dorea sp.]|nr:hypothetical protein [Dorea sp.]
MISGQDIRQNRRTDRLDRSDPECAIQILGSGEYIFCFFNLTGDAQSILIKCFSLMCKGNVFADPVKKPGA